MFEKHFFKSKMITNTIINYYQLYDFISLRCKKCCYLFGFFSCHYWFELILVLVFLGTVEFFFFYICHVVNIKFIGWYIMYFCQPGFFFPSKIYNVAYRSPSYIVLLLQQQTEYRSKNTTELSHTQRWRLTADDSSSQNNGGCW